MKLAYNSSFSAKTVNTTPVELFEAIPDTGIYLVHAKVYGSMAFTNTNRVSIHLDISDSGRNTIYATGAKDFDYVPSATLTYSSYVDATFIGSLTGSLCVYVYLTGTNATYTTWSDSTCSAVQAYRLK